MRVSVTQRVHVSPTWCGAFPHEFLTRNGRIHTRLCCGAVTKPSVFISGSAGGIGAATARKFAQEGAAVVVCDVNESALGQVTQACRKAGAETAEYCIDMTDRLAVDEVVASVIRRFGRIDVLVNNAGITRDARLQKMTLDQFDAVPCRCRTEMSGPRGLREGG